jgi:anti-anti-sigma factor
VLITSSLLLAIEESESTLRLRIAGEFDRAGVRAVEKALQVRRIPAPSRVVFDLRALAFLDLAGLRMILRTDAQARLEAFEVVVVRPRSTANRVFTLTRAGERLTIVDEPEAA